MSEIKGFCSHTVAETLAAKGAVKAQVLGRAAIVWAGAWEPTTVTGAEAKHFIRAKAIREDGRDLEAEGTPSADAPIQQLITSSVNWEPWPT